MYFIDTDEGKKDIFSIRHGGVGLDPSIHNEPLSKKNYLIAFTGRSGSTLLCSLLKQAEAFGQPDEFTNPRGPMQMYLSRYPAQDLQSYMGLLRRRYAGPNGVFGMKSSYLDFEPMLREGLVAKCLAPLQFVYLTRRDIVLQAISFARAKQTSIWHSFRRSSGSEGEGDIVTPTFDESAILREVDGLITQQLQWEKFFTLYSIDPLRITYEDILADAGAVLGRIAAYLDIASYSEVTLKMAETKKLGDELSIEWATRIRNAHKL